MTGTVFRILVNVGDTVEADQDVIVLESMKMEMPVQSTSRGTVAEIMVAVDDFVQEGDLLLTLKE